jgi:hypothetical protein
MLRRPVPVFVPKLKQTASLATNLGETARFVNGRASKTKPTAIADEWSLIEKQSRSLRI